MEVMAGTVSFMVLLATIASRMLFSAGFLAGICLSQPSG